MIYTSKCPGCGGVMGYDGRAGKLKCEYCGTEVEIADWSSGVMKTGESPDAAEKGRVCAVCGGLLEEEYHTAAKPCPYCGATNVFEEKVRGKLPVRVLVPFRLTKQDCRDILARRMKRCIFAPASFRSDSTMEHIRGVYLPYFLFDVKGRIRANFHGTKIHSFTDGDYNVTVTRHFDIYRDLSSEYGKVPLDGMKSLDDNKSRSIEPFQYQDLKRFAPAYLMGYEAGEADISVEDAKAGVRPLVERYLRDEARDTVFGYSGVTLKQADFEVNFTDEIPALMPAWILQYRYRDKDYDILMNGQNGKLVGSFPVSGARIAAFFLTVFLILFVLVFAVLFWVLQ